MAKSQEAAYSVLVVDDSGETCDLLEILLNQIDLPKKLDVAKATRPEDAIALLNSKPFDLMLSDINLEAVKDGVDLLRAAKPMGVETILLTGFGTIEKALEAVKEGAFDFVSKPWDNEELKSLVKRALLMRADRGKAPKAKPRAAHSAIIGSSPQMMEVYKKIASLQDSRSTVLIIGESGTGKELVARAIYQSSSRRDRPFVATNCGSLTESLLESELFGHAKGAFTGAIGEKVGLFEEANGGTIFLDEIGEISPSFQVRLLRVLQEGELRRVGSSKNIIVDIRVIAATNRNLFDMVAEGKFREDLYYRLSVVEIALPPVRERYSIDPSTKKKLSDITLLIDYFLEEAQRKDGHHSHIRADAMELLKNYAWPGNVREIANVVEHLTQMSRGRQIAPEDLPEKIRNGSLADAPPHHRAAKIKSDSVVQAPLLDLIEGWDGLPTLEELEKKYIQALLKHYPRKAKVAEILGKDRTTLYRKLRDLGLE
ncbi:MAG: sigma-54 dependent transcriptional regulator [Holophagales bacterium]|jgi:DNA-binding NtrC family response regulator|nr:sigma-54 dependent transcriptional regulator [Holophagales bacterium]